MRERKRNVEVFFIFSRFFGVGVFSFVASAEETNTKNIMSSLVASSLEWLLKRALRFVVQRFLGRVLKSEVRDLGKMKREVQNDLVDGDIDSPSSVPFFFPLSASPLFFFLSAPAVSGDHPARETRERACKKKQRKTLPILMASRRGKKATKTITSTRSSLSSSFFFFFS